VRNSVHTTPDVVENVAERRFAWLLKQRGYGFWLEDQLEEKIEVRATRPDFYVETPANGSFLVEVESFEKPGPLRGLSRGGARAVNTELVFKRIRTAVQDAAEQLRPYKELGIPMLVVLDNWRMVGIPSNVVDLRNALFGTLEFRFPVNLDTGAGVMDEAHWHHGGGQFFNPKEKLYIGAVAWNLPKIRYDDDRVKEERPMYLRVVHNPWAQVKFPIGIFNNRDDEHYGYIQHGDRLGWTNLLSEASRG
jgi:hypothetical protein